MQICHVDRLLKYEGKTPEVWARHDAQLAKTTAREGERKNDEAVIAVADPAVITVTAPPVIS
jgi:hypothetical protein